MSFWTDSMRAGLAALGVSLIVASVALGGCSEPTGIEPTHYCRGLPKFGADVVHSECLKVQENARKEKPAFYGCMSKCVVESSDQVAFTRCHQRCSAFNW